MHTSGLLDRAVGPPVIGSVHTRRDFDALRRARGRVRSGGLWLTHVPARPDPAATGPAGVKVAFAIPAKVGGAVVRNRIRRRLRSLLREQERAGAMPAGLYLLGVTPAAAGASHADLGTSLTAMLTRLAERS